MRASCGRIHWTTAECSIHKLTEGRSSRGDFFSLSFEYQRRPAGKMRVDNRRAAAQQWRLLERVRLCGKRVIYLALLFLRAASFLLFDGLWLADDVCFPLFYSTGTPSRGARADVRVWERRVVGRPLINCWDSSSRARSAFFSSVIIDELLYSFGPFGTRPLNSREACFLCLFIGSVQRLARRLKLKKKNVMIYDTLLALLSTWWTNRVSTLAFSSLVTTDIITYTLLCVWFICSHLLGEPLALVCAGAFEWPSHLHQLDKNMCATGASDRDSIRRREM